MLIENVFNQGPPTTASWQMLAERNPAVAQKLAAETILDFNRYDTDVARFRARRLQLLQGLARAGPTHTP